MPEADILPQGWFQTTISELCILNPKHSKDIDDATEISFIPMANVSDKTGEIIDFEIRKLGEVRKGYTHFSDDDVIWAKITPCMENGKAALVKELKNGFACGSTEFYVLRSKGGLTPKLLYYYIRQEGFRRAAKMVMGGAVGHQRVPKNFLLNRNFFLPPIQEQKRIANKIEALQAKSTKAKQALDIAEPLLDKLRQSILASAFRGDLTADWRKKNSAVEPASVLLERIRGERRKKWDENELAKMRAKGKEPKDDKWKSKYKEPEPVDIKDLPELPDGWSWIVLEELGIHKSGVAYKSKEFVSEGIQIVKLGNLYQGKFDLLRDPSFLPEDHPDIDKGIIEAKDLLISQTGTRHKRDYGNFVVIPDLSPPLVLNQRVLCVKMVETKLVNWILYASRLNLYKDHFFSHETGGVNQGNVGIAGVMRGPIPIAPLAEMLKVVSMIETAENQIRIVGKSINNNFQKLSDLNQSILSKAFVGELVPQDPSDEPASELLKRIKGDIHD
ncbi:MAG: restriction endonuclease subunit S [Bacteroidales bacterium]|jgi:type I restriction enzyme S subunit|nr:restriction endonuclease subunit S [Bacteroidales bacterium]